MGEGWGATPSCLKEMGGKLSWGSLTRESGGRASGTGVPREC